MQKYKQRLNFTGFTMTEQSQESLYNYLVHGFEPGSFMMSVLSNDLYGAVARADFVNIDLISQYAGWIKNHAPYGSYGDRNTVQGWLCKNEHFERFQKELTMDLLRTPESALNDPLF